MRQTAHAERYTPESFVFEVTRACNLHCNHCIVSAGDPREKEVSTRQATEVLRQMADIGCRKVSFTGGEPLMRPDLVELVGEASRIGMRVGLMTNGTLLDERKAAAARDAGLSSLGFSVDGVGEAHDRARGTVGTFERVRRAMSAARSAGLRFGAVTQINRANLSGLERLWGFLAEEGASNWRVQLCQPVGRMAKLRNKVLLPSELHSLVTRLARMTEAGGIQISTGHSLCLAIPGEEKHMGSCPAGRTSLAVLSNGDIAGCPTVVEVLPRSVAVTGNVLESTLEEIWYDDDAFSMYRTSWTNYLGGNCNSCHMLESCRGGCPGSWVNKGGYFQPLCSMIDVTEKELSQKKKVALAAFSAACITLIGLPSCATVAMAPTDHDNDSDAAADTDTYTDTDSDTDLDAGPDSGTGIDAGSDPDGGSGDAGADGGK